MKRTLSQAAKKISNRQTVKLSIQDFEIFVKERNALQELQERAHQLREGSRIASKTIAEWQIITQKKDSEIGQLRGALENSDKQVQSLESDLTTAREEIEKLKYLLKNRPNCSPDTTARELMDRMAGTLEAITHEYGTTQLITDLLTAYENWKKK